MICPRCGKPTIHRSRIFQERHIYLRLLKQMLCYEQFLKEQKKSRNKTL